MSCVLNGIDILYADNKLYKLRECGWREAKGCLDKKGYRVVKIGKKQYFYHRVVYKCNNNEWDIDDVCKDNHIDHIDRNPLNNNINNLRVVSQCQNNQNTNAKGYCWNKEYKKWQAYIGVNYKTIYLGSYHTEEEARNAYLEGRKKYNFI
jgi:hypothetical protein